MTSYRLEDRIRDLCAQAIAADDVALPGILSELRSALHESVERIRTLAIRQLAGSTVETKIENECRERLRGFAVKIATEQDCERFPPSSKR